MPEDAVGERLVAGAAGCGERIGDGCVTGFPVTAREQGDGQHPEREIPPRTALGLELDRAPSVGQHVVRAMPTHGRAQYRPARLERGGPIRRPAGEGAPLGDVREVQRPGGIAGADALPGRQDGQPWPLFELRVAEARQPRLRQGTPAGPVVFQHHPAHELGRQVEISGREGLGDCEVQLTRARVPGRSASVQVGHAIGLARAELGDQELTQQVVIAEPAAVLVHEQGRAGELDETPGGSGAVGHLVAEGAVESLKDRGAGQELDLLLGSPLEQLRAEVVGQGRAGIE